MISEMDYYQRRENAKKRVEEIKSFYTHLRVYILVNILLLLLRGEFLDFVTGKTENLDPNFLHWIDLNIFITPLLWGIGLAVHGIYVYRHKFTFVRKWEERQLQKFLEEEETDNNKYH